MNTATRERTRRIEVVGQVFRRVSDHDPQRVCLIHGDEELTYGQVVDRVNRLANSLLGLGVGKGEKVALLFSNVPTYVVSYLACASIGAVLVPVNVKFQGTEIKYVLENSDSVALLMAEEFLQPFAGLGRLPVQLRDVILCGLDDRLARGASLPHPSAAWRWHDFDQLIQEASPREPAVPMEPDDPLGIFYTSGTTGVPKGVVLTHRKALAGIDAWVDGLRLHERTRSLVIAPFFHIAFNAFVCSMFRVGGSTVIFDSFQLKQLLNEIERARPTFMFAIPSVYIMMVDYPHIRDHDLSSLESVVYGAAPMPVEIIHRVKALFSHALLYNAYGQTETSSAISRLRPEFAVSKAGSVGTPLKGVDVTILDDDDRPVSPGTLGEICVRGPNIFLEYYKMPEVTAKKLRGGWHHTGDLGFFDADRFLYIGDRKDDLIISKGEKISPKEVEEVLFTHPDVLDAAVVGVPDRVSGEVVAAFIVPRAGRRPSPASLRRFCRDRMAAYKAPRYVHTVERIPRNPSGKTLRHALRRMHVEAGAVAVPV